MERFIQFINESNEVNNQLFNIQIFENLIENIISDDRSENQSITKNEFIDSLEEIENQEENLTCSICIDEFKIGEKCIKLPCKDNPHYFHRGNDTCPGIIEWLKKSNTCPICRYEFPKEEVEPNVARIIIQRDPENADAEPDLEPDGDALDEAGPDNAMVEEVFPELQRRPTIFEARLLNIILEREEQRQIDLAIQESLNTQ